MDLRRYTGLTICGLAVAWATLVGSTATAQDKPWSESSSFLGQQVEQPTGRLDEKALNRLIDIGEGLFAARFTTEDGAGRPKATQAIIPTKTGRRTVAAFARASGPDSSGCASCHNLPIAGGAGDFVTNVFLSEGFNQFDFQSTDPQFSNERGTNHLFGAGLIELLAREMTEDLGAIRAAALAKARETKATVRSELVTKSVNFGAITATPDGIVGLEELDGVDTDLVIRPFSQKGVMTSLRQFTVNAMNHHHGMQAQERFGLRWTDEDDFDEDGYSDELSNGDIAALVAWQAALPAPVQDTRGDPAWTEAAKAGQEVFRNLGCNICHVEALPLRSLSFLDPGPSDAAGTLSQSQVGDAAIYDLELLEWTKSLPRDAQGQVLVPLFGDLKRHNMTDQTVDALGNELMAQRFVDRTVFATTELWGVGSTAPYGHRNDFTTLDSIIQAHGGSARFARDAYLDASDQERDQIVAFLKSLVINHD
jgi:cytochrome c peroxidase